MRSLRAWISALALCRSFSTWHRRAFSRVRRSSPGATVGEDGEACLPQVMSEWMATAPMILPFARMGAAVTLRVSSSLDSAWMASTTSVTRSPLKARVRGCSSSRRGSRFFGQRSRNPSPRLPYLLRSSLTEATPSIRTAALLQRVIPSRVRMNTAFGVVSRIAFISVRFRSSAETRAEKDLRFFTGITSE